MTRSDLKIFDIVKTRCGQVLIILPNSICDSGKGTYSEESCGCQEYLSSYSEDLKYKNGSSKDIVAIRKDSSAWRSCGIYFENKDSIEDWTWEREEIKQVTMADVEEKFGCKVKIVKEEE